MPSPSAYTLVAIIKTETYRFITTGETTVGSYIMLDQYEVQMRDKIGGGGQIA